MQKSKRPDFPFYFWANPFVKSKSNECCDYASELSKIHLDYIIYALRYSAGGISMIFENVEFWALLKYIDVQFETFYSISTFYDAKCDPIT